MLPKIQIFQMINLMKRPLIIITAPKGILACKYMDVKTANDTDDTLCTFSNVNNYKEILNSPVVECSNKAQHLGIYKGMKGYYALLKLI
tara:strand:- start:1481 stop:1747 length:267 start_codon:yes stop_codon:yes gene_type:complete